jgi:hypothetical protein
MPACFSVLPAANGLLHRHINVIRQGNLIVATVNRLPRPAARCRAGNAGTADQRNALSAHLRGRNAHGVGSSRRRILRLGSDVCGGAGRKAHCERTTDDDQNVR